MRRRFRFPWRRDRRRRQDEGEPPEERSSGEEAILSREEEGKEATPSGMPRLKTHRL